MARRSYGKSHTSRHRIRKSGGRKYGTHKFNTR